MEYKGYKFGTGSIGWLIALVVFILCIAAWFFSKPLSSNEVLGLIALLALSRLI